MCGICGFYNLAEAAGAQQLLDKMTESLRHRGPDGRGTWLSSSGTMGFGQTRLAIIDLIGGKQPMISGNGRYVIVYNGEIYNFQSLKKELLALGHSFHSNSDTEVLLEGFAEWGKGLLRRLHGMFAFAIFDQATAKLFLARDRTGIKPLYYYAGKEGFFFGSEPKALLQASLIPRQLNFKALADFFVLGYALTPATLFENIFELRPGAWLEIGQAGVKQGEYWRWVRQEMDWDEPEALEQLEHVLVESLQEHLVADVPIGAFLSGGIDSSLLVALLGSRLGVKLDTFNVKFGESNYDESPFARMVANHLGTRHHEINLHAATSDLALVNSILDQFDQPFGDTSAIPTYLITKEIGKYVKVVIGGDGGDEMCGGYRRFYYADVAHRLRRLPGSNLGLLLRILRVMPSYFAEWSRKSERLLHGALSGKENPLLSLVCYNYPENFAKIFRPEAMCELSDYRPLSGPEMARPDPDGRDLIDLTVSFELPGDYLRKVDFMSSAHGIEVRVPFLGNQVLACAAQISPNLQYSLRKNKILLRKLASRYLPPEIVDKPKGGFAIPLDSWLGLSRREALADILGSKRAKMRDLIQPQWIETLLQGFVSGTWNRAKMSRFTVNQNVYFLWALERWLNKWNPSY